MIDMRIDSKELYCFDEVTTEVAVTFANDAEAS